MCDMMKKIRFVLIRTIEMSMRLNVLIFCIFSASIFHPHEIFLPVMKITRDIKNYLCD